MMVDSCWPTTLCHLLMYTATPPLHNRPLHIVASFSGHHVIQSNPCDRVPNLHRKQLKNQYLQYYKKMLAVVPIALTILSECKQN
uniref:Uncharacterized protein n=1 Tax=Arundo donax TaxID=35708 RepID=A0A0A9EG55_ARUDO